MIVMIPAVPAFPGNLKSDDALSTRAIMEFQYTSINRGGHSIYEEIARAGFNPMEYIRFFNVRSYDRINVSAVMQQVEQQTGVSYEDARKEHDAAYGGKYEEGGNAPPQYQQQYQPQQPQQQHQPQQSQQQYQPEQPQQQYQAYHPPISQGPQYGSQVQGQQSIYEMDSSYNQSRGLGGDEPVQSRGYGQQGAYQQYQQGAAQIGDRKGLGSGRWDSVAECYMMSGQDIRSVPWEHGDTDEIDAFVSEELYIHSKVRSLESLPKFDSSVDLGNSF